MLFFLILSTGKASEEEHGNKGKAPEEEHENKGSISYMSLFLFSITVFPIEKKKLNKTSRTTTGNSSF
jgi:hypothetical protein